ncbi:MAG TPA: hypothetical protein ACFCUD_08185 [Cyclobacteriaceae bacterium]
MRKAIVIGLVFSRIIFVISLILVYAYLPIKVELISLDNLNILRIDKQDYFFWLLGLFLAVNLILFVLSKYILSSQSSTLSAGELQSRFYFWILGLSAILNIFLALLNAFTGINNNASHIDPQRYYYLNYIGPLLIVGWFLLIIPIFFQKTKTT